MNDQLPRPPFESQQQPMPGVSDTMNPRPNYGEDSYRGSGRRDNKAARITGANSGIGRAVALGFARDGTDVLISCLNEHEDAAKPRQLVEGTGRKSLVVPGDVSDAGHCRDLVRRAVSEFGRIDVLVNNAAHQASFESIEDISDEEWNKTLATNISAMFYLAKARSRT
jgi:NAD(P)-dependent dehydrogenase (short-subunit alcohol dehydrogenase family)